MVSMTSLAKHAGVSQTTVSRVLNNPDQVKKETYEKVMSAIDELGYTTGSKEKVNHTSNSRTIRLLVSSEQYSALTSYVDGIIQKADEQGYLLTVHFVSPNKSEEIYKSLVSEGTAGVIILSKLAEGFLLEKLERSKIPFVVLDTNQPVGNYSVGMNNVEAGYKATSYMLEAGHKKVFWVGGPLNSQEHKDRFLGFIHALQANKSKIRKKRLVVTDTDEASLHKVFEKLLTLKKKPTAIVAATDEIAIALMNLYLEAGWEVPEDISIIGIGNSETGSHPAIGLTSVGMNKREAELGREAISILLGNISEQTIEPLHVLKDVSIFARNTTQSN